MKSNIARMFGIAAVIGSVAVLGCGKQSDSDTRGVGERTGAALDKAADKTVEMGKTVGEKTSRAAKQTAEKAKDVAGKAVEKTGEAMGTAGTSVEKAGTAVEKTGEDMQE